MLKRVTAVAAAVLVTVTGGWLWAEDGELATCRDGGRWFSVQYPARLFHPKADKGGGRKVFVSTDGRAEIAVTGGEAYPAVTLCDLYNAELLRPRPGGRITHKTLRSEYFIIAGTDGDKAFLCKTVLSRDKLLRLTMRYPAKEHAVYDAPAAAVARSFVLFDGESAVEPVHRNRARLKSIPARDFSRHRLNGRIAALLASPDACAAGLVRTTNALIVSGRFGEKIIDGVGIGTPRDALIGALGTPDIEKDEDVFYKTGEYYLGFRGREKVEAAIVAPRPQMRDEAILATLMAKLRDRDLETAREEDPVIDGLFQSALSAARTSGGWYWVLDNGLAVEESYNDGRIEIYNNFEGGLYVFKQKGARFRVVFVDEDATANDLHSQLASWQALERSFAAEGKISPDGKRKLLFDRSEGVRRHFIVRRLDNAGPDAFLIAPAQEYCWLDDRHILWLRSPDSLPMVTALDDSYNERPLNVLQAAGLESEPPASRRDKPYDFKIIAVRDGRIVLRNAVDDKTYSIGFGSAPRPSAEGPYIQLAK